jgi:predicted histone-like DNA-binding protein
LISARSILNSGDIIAVVESFVQIIPELLQDGYNVRLDDLGTFSLHASAVGQDAPNKVSSRDITNFKISFLPDKRIKERMQSTEVYKG